MKMFFVAASLCLAASAAYANAFVKYGKSDSPEVRRNY